ncbi:MAG: hypothetical protein WD381_08435 [Balneolaceae bacterium]
MMGEEVAIVAIVFGSILTIVFLGIVGSIINNIVKRKSSKGNLSENKEFLAALREFKEKTESRLSNLEAIAIDDDPQKSRQKKTSSVKEQNRSIDIELNDESGEGKPSNSGNLRNMLNQ